jgi:hypothetical protein
MYVVCLQLVFKFKEFKLLLVVGRRLVFPAQSSTAVSVDLTTQVQFEAAGGITAMRTVSLMFPANCRTVVRLMEAWYDAQVSLSMLAGSTLSTSWMAGLQAAAAPLQLVEGEESPPHPSLPGGGGGGTLVPPPPPTSPALAAAVWCIAVQPDIISKQRACAGCGCVMQQKASLPPSCKLSTLKHCHHKAFVSHHSTVASPWICTQATLPNSLQTFRLAHCDRKGGPCCHAKVGLRPDQLCWVLTVITVINCHHWLFLPSGN